MTSTTVTRLDVIAGVSNVTDYLTAEILTARDTVRAATDTVRAATDTVGAAADWVLAWDRATRLDSFDDDGGAFLGQNAAFATTLETLDPVDMATALDGYAGHHSGGLMVLWREIDGGLMVKCHDSWGGPDDDGREIVVHTYDAEGDGTLVEDGGTDLVRYYATAGEAFAAFMDAAACEESDHGQCLTHDGAAWAPGAPFCTAMMPTTEG